MNFESIRPLLFDFEKSSASYDALWVKVTAGQALVYRRIQIIDQNIWFCSGDEHTLPKYSHRTGLQEVEQLFNKIRSGNYFEQPTLSFQYSTEPGLESVCVKKRGVTICSYAIDYECLYNLPVEEEAKIAEARALVAYMNKLE